MNKVHKIGDVLDINIDGTTISCLVIKELDYYSVDYKDSIIFSDVETPNEPWFPHDSLALSDLNIEHTIENWEGAGPGRIKSCCQLLIGDKKVWLNYGDECY